MTNIRPEALQSTKDLPDHRRLLVKTSEYFQNVPGIISLFVSGSTATGGMDIYSDLDLGFLCADENARKQIWENRWEWNIDRWFHRFDADHIKPNFIIYFFEPNVHVDFNFYTESDLPTSAGAPYLIAWDKSGKMDSWLSRVNVNSVVAPDWSNAVHEDERFWAWMHYASSHAARGEFYDTVSFLKDIRSIVESWEARLQGLKMFSSRRAEEKYPQQFMIEMGKTFCEPSKTGLMNAFQALAKIQLRQRRTIEERIPIKWKTSGESINHIRNFAETLKY